MAAALWRSLGRRKAIPSATQPTTAADHTPPLARVLTTWDLTALGVGSTLGVGVYVLAGEVARRQAGPAVLLSFVVAGLASGLAGLCYAEFGARVPLAGSAYVYSYVSVGELLAFVIGWSLVLEYAIGSASVARALTSYVDQLTGRFLERTFAKFLPMHAPFLASYADPMSFIVAFGLSVVLAFGVRESLSLNNIFAGLNMAVILFVVVAGCFKANAKNWSLSPRDAPSGAHVGTGGFMPFGLSGVLRGAATCFYGFVGFDCIAASGEEVRRPQRAIPIAILGSLVVVCLSYLAVAAVLTLMWPYYDLADDGAPLAAVFRQIGWPVAQWIVAIGGIFGLVTSLFGTMFPLPRVVYAMATDGLIFRFLGDVHARYQTPFVGTILAGLLTGIMAALFHLQQLVDMLSIGTLMAYTLVAACVLLLRYRPSEDEQTPQPTPQITICGIFGYLINAEAQRSPTKITGRVGTIMIILHCLLSIGFAFCLVYHEFNFIPLGIVACLMTLVVVSLALQPSTTKLIPFKVPLVPVIPAVSITLNMYLMLLLDRPTWIRFSIWMAVGILLWVIFVAYRCCLPREKPTDKSLSSHDNAGFEGDQQGQTTSNDISLDEMRPSTVISIVDGIVTHQNDKKQMNGNASFVKDAPSELRDETLGHNQASVGSKDINVLTTSSAPTETPRQERANRFIRPTSVIEGELSYEKSLEVAPDTVEIVGKEKRYMGTTAEPSDGNLSLQDIRAKRRPRLVRPTSIQQGTVSFESVSEISSENTDVLSSDGDAHSLYPEVFIMPSEDKSIQEENEVPEDGTREISSLEEEDSDREKMKVTSPEKLTDSSDYQTVQQPEETVPPLLKETDHDHIPDETVQGPGGTAKASETVPQNEVLPLLKETDHDHTPEETVQGPGGTANASETVLQNEVLPLLKETDHDHTPENKGDSNSADECVQPDSIVPESNEVAYDTKSLSNEDSFYDCSSLPEEQQTEQPNVELSKTDLTPVSYHTGIREEDRSAKENESSSQEPSKSSLPNGPLAIPSINDKKSDVDEKMLPNNADTPSENDEKHQDSSNLKRDETPNRALDQVQESSATKKSPKLPNFSISSYDNEPIDVHEGTRQEQQNNRSKVRPKKSFRPEKFQDPNFLGNLSEILARQSFNNHDMPRPVVKRQTSESANPRRRKTSGSDSAFVKNAEGDSDGDDVFVSCENIPAKVIPKHPESSLPNGPVRTSVAPEQKSKRTGNAAGRTEEGGDAKPAEDGGRSEMNVNFREKLSAILLNKHTNGPLPSLKDKETEKDANGGYSSPERNNNNFSEANEERDKGNNDSKNDIKNRLSSFLTNRAKKPKPDVEEISTVL